MKTSKYFQIKQKSAIFHFISKWKFNKMLMLFVVLLLHINSTTLFSQQVKNFLYLSSEQTLNRIDPVATEKAEIEYSYPLSSGITQVTLSQSSSSAQTATSHTFNYNSGNTGVDRVLMVGISYRNGNNRAVNTVTYAGQTMTLVGDFNYFSGTTYYARVYIYRLVNPSFGANALAVTWNGALTNGSVIGAVTYSGVDIANPTGAFGSASGNNSTPSVTVQSGIGRLLFGVVSGRTTSIYNVTTPNAASLWSAMPYSGLTSGSGQSVQENESTVLRWSGSSSRWAASGVSLIPAARDTIRFTMDKNLCTNLTIHSGTIEITSYLSILKGSMPVNPEITAELRHGNGNIITISNPTYDNSAGLLKWTGQLAANVNIPSGQKISLFIRNNQADVVYRLEYDSEAKPSKIEFITSSTIKIDNFQIHTDVYPEISPVGQMVVNTPYFIRTSVINPFGSEDINRVELTIADNLDILSTIQLNDLFVASADNCSKTYEYMHITNDVEFYKLHSEAFQGSEGTISDESYINYIPVVRIDAFDDYLEVEMGNPGLINVLDNDKGNLNVSSLQIIDFPHSGTIQYGQNGEVFYLPNGNFIGTDFFIYRICDSYLINPTCDIATVYVTVLPEKHSPCNEAVKTKIYYMPFPENSAQLRDALFQASDNYSGFTNVARTVISIASPYPNTIIIYDEWEDGYEVDITNPLQSTTKIWGDGILSNGVAPGYPNDIIPAGGSIILDNAFIYNPRNPSNIYFDGKDKIFSTADLAISKISGDNAWFHVQSAKTDVYDISRFDKLFRLGLGEIVGSPYFAYASLFIRAAYDNTTVSIDLNADGIVDVTNTLNEGEVWFYQGNPAANAVATSVDIKPGTVITSTQPIGVDVLFGGNDNFGTRNINILPSKFYGNTYYSPVPTTLSSAPSVVYFVNSLPSPILVNWASGTGNPNTGTVVVPSESFARLTLSNNSAYKFWSQGGESFTAVQVMDADASGSAYDWAITLVGEDRLTNFASVAWAPGSADGSRNDNPIWVTPVENTTIYVKFDGNLTGYYPTMSPCNLPFDIAVPLNKLHYYQIRDNSDNDQSGLSLYTCDGTAFFAVYGQDPATAVAAYPSLDVGTILSPKCLNHLINAVDDYEVTQPNTTIIIDPSKNDIGFLCSVDPLSLSTLGMIHPSHGFIEINPTGTLTYTPNYEYIGYDMFSYRICSAEYPNTCDIAKIHITVTDCNASAKENLITGKVYVESFPDNGMYDGEIFAPGVKVDLYSDYNCNGAIDGGDLFIKSTVSDLSGNYSLTTINGLFAKDDFDPTPSFSGNDGSVNWSSNWSEQGDNNNFSTGNIIIMLDNAPGATGNAIRLSGASKGISRTRAFSNAVGAKLIFSYRRQGLNKQGEALFVRMNGTTIFTINDGGDLGTDNYYQTINILLPLQYYNPNGNNTVQFITNNVTASDDFFWIDNVELFYFQEPTCFTVRIDPINNNNGFSPAQLNIQSAAFSIPGECDKDNYLGVYANLIATNDIVYTSVDIPVTVSVLTNDVIGIPLPSSVSTQGLMQPTLGQANVNQNGTITYIPNPGAIGTDQFQYRVCSVFDTDVCSVALVSIHIACIHIPNQNIINGLVFLDIYNEGVLDDTDGKMDAVAVNLFLDQNGNGILDTNEPLVQTTITNSLGAYQFNIIPPTTERIYLDQFNSNTTANQSHGNVSWSLNPWIEINESDGFGSGDIRIASAYGLRIQNRNKGARRTANLTGAIAATVSFNYTETGLELDPGDYVDVEIATSANPSQWTLLKRYTGGDGNQSGFDSFDVTQFISSTTTIRFISSPSTEMVAGDIVYFDNVQISYHVPLPAQYIVRLEQPLPQSFAMTLPSTNPESSYIVSFQGIGAGSCQNNFGLVKADLGIVSSVHPIQPVTGELLTYTIQIANYGPSNAQNIQVINDVDISLSSAHFSFHPNGPWSLWEGYLDIEQIDPGSHLTFYIRDSISINHCGTITNLARVLSSGNDPNPNNNNTEITQQVYDDSEPEIVCPANILNVQTEAGNCFAHINELGFPLAFDNCFIESIINDAPAVYQDGLTVVTWIAIDGNGNASTCEQIVTVIDMVNPVILCQEEITLYVESDKCGIANENLPLPDVSDNCFISLLSNDAPEIIPVGLSTVSWIVFDARGNNSTCIQNLVVIDSIAPLAPISPADTTYTTIDEVPEIQQLTAFDNCLGEITVEGVQNDNGGIGCKDDPLVINRTWTFLDLAGNQYEVTQQIIVIDLFNDCILLPVDLLSFNGTCTISGIELHWTTATEKNNDYFVIEHSNDAINWKEIKKISGSGNSNSVLNYKVVHQQTEENNFYRLKQVDFDGKYEYFSPISVSCNSNLSDFTIKAYPNPFIDEIHIEVNIQKQNGTLVIMNSNAQIIHTENLGIGQGKDIESTIVISLSNHPHGIYYVIMTTKNDTNYVKIIKQ